MMTTRRKTLLIVLALAVIGIVGYVVFSQMDKQSSPPNKQADHSKAEKTDDTKKNTTDDNIEKQAFSEPVLDKAYETHIVALGDSLTQGVGDSKKAGGYVGILETELTTNGYHVRVDNHGKAGDRTDQLLKKINTEEEVKTSIQEADIILITIGANDIMKVLRDNITDLDFEHFEREEPKYEERLHEIFTILRSENKRTEIYLLGFYNPFGQYFDNIPELVQIVNVWNEASKEIAESYEGIYYIPMKDIFDESVEHLFYEDNFHPNDRGYELMAKRVYGRITK